jgi:hypothetical protein
MESQEMPRDVKSVLAYWVHPNRKPKRMLQAPWPKMPAASLSLCNPISSTKAAIVEL